MLPLNHAVALEPAKEVFRGTVRFRGDLDHGLVEDSEAVLSRLAALCAVLLVPPLVALLNNGERIDDFLIYVVSLEGFGFLADEVLDSDLACLARVGFRAGGETIGPLDVASGSEKTLDVRVLIVNEAIAVTGVALTARLFSVGAVLVVAFAVEFELIQGNAEWVPGAPGLERHLIQVLE